MHALLSKHIAKCKEVEQSGDAQLTHIEFPIQLLPSSVQILNGPSSGFIQNNTAGDDAKHVTLSLMRSASPARVRF